MEIDDSEFESRRHEIIGELRSSILNIAGRVMNYCLQYKNHKDVFFLILSDVLKTVAAGLLVVVLLPDRIGWRPLYALAAAVICYTFAVVFHVEGKE